MLVCLRASALALLRLCADLLVCLSIYVLLCFCACMLVCFCVCMLLGSVASPLYAFFLVCLYTCIVICFHTSVEFANLCNICFGGYLLTRMHASTNVCLRASPLRCVCAHLQNNHFLADVCTEMRFWTCLNQRIESISTFGMPPESYESFVKLFIVILKIIQFFNQI